MRAKEFITESLTGQQMLAVFRQHKHHRKERNAAMDQFILDHDWGIKMIDARGLPRHHEINDDPFDRIIDIDPDQVDHVKDQLAHKQKIEPIIMGPKGHVIDGNHRLAAAQELGRDILAYIPMEAEVDEGLRDVAAAGALAAGLAFGGGQADAAKQPVARPAVVQPAVKSVTGTAEEMLLRQTAESAGIRGNELTAFLSQCAHETLNFTRLKEFGGKLDFRKYDPKFNPAKAKKLGNTQAGDGARYKGRGFIQLTGRYNYKKAGEELNLPLEKHPELVENPKIAAVVAVWFWKHRVQPKVSDYSNVQSVTKPINPGMKGMPSRQEKFDTFKVAMR